MKIRKYRKLAYGSQLLSDTGGSINSSVDEKKRLEDEARRAAQLSAINPPNSGNASAVFSQGMQPPRVPEQVQNTQAASSVTQVASAVPVWGQVFNATQGVSKAIKGDELNTTNNAIGSVLSPSSGVLSAIDDKDYGDAIISAFNPIGGGKLQSDRAKKKKQEAQEKQYALTQDFYTTQGTNRLANVDLTGGQEETGYYERGGPIPPKKQPVLSPLNKEDDPAMHKDRIWWDDDSKYIDDAGNLKDRKPTQRLYMTKAQRSIALANEFNNEVGFNSTLKQFKTDPNETRMAQYKTIAEGKNFNKSGFLGQMKTIGGDLKKLNSDSFEVAGNTHQEGGVKIPGAGAELEDKETVSGNYVFSDALGFSNIHKKIAKKIGTLEKKPQSKEVTTSIGRLRDKEKQLASVQEEVRTNMGVDDDQFEKVAGGIMKKYDFGSVVTGAAPYISNVANMFRKLPKVPEPVLESNFSPELVDFNNDRVSLDKILRGSNVGIDAATSNPSIARAAKVANMSKFLSARGELSQQEANMNAGIVNRNREANQLVNLRNTERKNGFLSDQVARTIAQQNLRSENLADATNKFQLQQRDNSLMDLESRKIDINSRQFEDTGVYNRNLYDDYIEEQRRLGKRKLGGKILIGRGNLLI